MTQRLLYLIRHGQYHHGDGDEGELTETGLLQARLTAETLREIDFNERSVLGAIEGTNFADWPISYAELEPYYTRVDWEIGVSGAPGPFDSPRSKPFPMPPMAIKSSGALLGWDEVSYHANNIFSGMFSLGGGSDRILVEERLHPHSAFDKLAFRGVPDLRIIVFRGVPVMSMLRLPTSISDGKANLHVGGVGVGVDMASGITTKGVCFNKPIERHPDFDTPLTGFAVPHWSDALDTASQLGHAIGLGYIGVDLVVDETHGPTMLELNARPGISIQIANGLGLEHRLRKIHETKDIPDDPAARRAFAEEVWKI